MPRVIGYGSTPAEIHHERDGQGAGQRATHFEVLPLYPHDHRIGGHGVVVHAGRKTWEKNYGTERHLLAQVLAEVENNYEY
ncbi:hypothetical protein NJH77_22700 [Serratia fonticola]|nr:hypothetical protein CRN79_20800 [Serratia fonticola]MCO7512061.1 hypothetical protein [Serratia fonticola]